MKKPDLISGLALLLLAGVFYLEARKLIYWSHSGPGPGFFPSTLSILLGGLGGIILFQALLRAPQNDQKFQLVGPQRGKILSYLLAFMGFGLVFNWLGYSLTLTAFLIFILQFVERQSWKITLAVISISVIASHIIFRNLLQLSLPDELLLSLLDLWR
jgi:putative tricarboxylic transport membrane protein